MGVEVASYAPVLSMDDIDSAPDSLFPGILKAARLGYDGKGQVRIETRAQARAAYKTLNNAPCVLEAMKPLVRAISIVVRSEENTSELQSQMRASDAGFCLTQTKVR